MTARASVVDRELVTAEFASNPYPTYRRLLSSDSPCYSEARGGWLISRFEDVVGGLRDWEHFSSEDRVGSLLDHFTPAETEQLGELERWSSLKGIIHSDPPDHSLLRGLMIKSFTRRTVEQLRPRVEALVSELLDQVRGKDEFDVVGDLAARLPAAVISEMLGVPEDDRERFMSWSDAALGLQGNQRATLDTALEAQQAYVELQAYFADLIEERRRTPRNEAEHEDLLTNLVLSADDAPEIDDDMLIQSCITLLMGGFETTTSLISNTILLLLRHPETLVRVRTDDRLMSGTIEESLRFETPIQSVTRRVAKDVVMGSETLFAGDLAVFLLGAANRDHRQFDQADRFDIERDNRHVAFGYGVHFCIGAPLARLEAPIAVREVINRFPNLKLADERIAWDIDKTVIRCPERLMVAP